MSQSLARALIIILVMLYGFLLFEFLAQEVTVKNIIKVFTAVSAPLPLTIFVAYIFVARETFINPEVSISVLSSFTYLLVTLLFSLIFLHFFESLIYNGLSETIVPIFLNSFVLAMYVINIFLTKSVQMMAVLSGMSIGISLYVLFSS